ncbi:MULTISPECIES: DUF202 domain-containing protein [Nocardiaceae]|uniref:DUF202 domain-containing protein n=1 Tax=Nocardiaceae TaxID=85025 RepID=UPI00195D457D|nr:MULTISPECIES: DUF202 domain-containing protein [Rhodococcus]
MTRPPESRPAGVLGDGGLQVERTALAWRRTECSVAVCALVGLRLAAHQGNVPTAVAAGVVLTGAVAVVVVDTVRLRKRSRADAGPDAPRAIPARAPALAVLTASLGILALIVARTVTFGPGL